MWGEQYVRQAADLLQVQADISHEIARKLQLRLTQGQQQRLATHDVRNPEAYELLLKGHFSRAKGGADDRQKAGDYFAQAIAVDPGYALAHADLADIYRSLVTAAWSILPSTCRRRERPRGRALELDDNLAEAHYALANLMTYAWEWADAEREYKRAIALNPNLALAHRWYASYLRLVGRHDEAIAEIMRARELDPLSPGVNATVGFVLASARRYEQAIADPAKTIELDPTVSLLVRVPGVRLLGSAQVRGRHRRLSEGHHAGSRHADHADCARRGLRAGGRPRAGARGARAAAVEDRLCVAR